MGNNKETSTYFHFKKERGKRGHVFKKYKPLQIWQKTEV